MLRIAVGGFHHETNTFAPTKATYEHFARTDSWPGLQRGQGLLEALAGKNIPLSGFVAAAPEGWELLPTLWCNASPSAHVEQAAYERITDALFAELRALGPVDAVFLDLHGAAVCEYLEDAEGPLLTQVRRIVGPDVPVVACLDIHANVTAEMVEAADVLVGYRTYPHVDMAETGARSAQVLARVLAEGKPAKAWAKLDFLVSINWQCTLMEPSKAVYEAIEALETAQPDVFVTSYTPGFPPADIHDCGPAVFCYGATPSVAQAACDAVAEEVLSRRDQFDGGFYTPAEAVTEAARLGERGVKPVVIADTQDNPGGGGDGNTAGMLKALVEGQAVDAVFGLYIDPAVADAAHSTGVGGSLEASFGGNWDGDERFTLTATVERLGNGKFHCTGPFYGGNDMDLGNMALLRVGESGVRVIVASRKVQPADKEMFRCMGVEPAATSILVLKSSVHFRADFTFEGGEILVATAPGPVTADPAALPYRNLRPGVRLGPNGPLS
jgi:microcystin degradation protein MlrC